MNISIDETKSMFDDAEMVLVGIGKEFDPDIIDVIKENEIYNKFEDEISGLGSIESTFAEHAIYYHELTNGNNKVINNALLSLNKLAKILDGKNYFVVSTCTNSILKYSDIREDRLVLPCGDITRLECSVGCNETVIDGREQYEKLYKRLKSCFENNEFDKSFILSNIPVCEKCDAVMEANTFTGLSYQENGYLDKWELYQKWLTGTMNKNLLVLEISVGFETPTVIRWPFEKIVMINNKSKMIRINEKFAMVTPEIADKTYTFSMSGREFIEEYR